MKNERDRTSCPRTNTRAHSSLSNFLSRFVRETLVPSHRTSIMLITRGNVYALLNHTLPRSSIPPSILADFNDAILRDYRACADFSFRGKRLDARQPIISGKYLVNWAVSLCIAKEIRKRRVDAVLEQR